MALALFRNGSPEYVFADGELKVEVSEIDVTGYPTVRFIATVSDQGGRTLASLNPQDFTVTGRGKNIPIASVQSLSDANIGVSSLLLIDTSGSMAGAPILAARDSAVQFLEAQKPVDEVAIMTFADSVRLVSNFTNDFEDLRQNLQGLAARGNTTLYQSVAEAAAAARTRTNERRVIVLISDGADFGGLGQTTRQQSLNAVRDAGIPFYIVGLGPDIDRQYLQQLADTSKGRLFLAPDAGQLKALYADITQIVRTHYVVTLDLNFTDLEGEVLTRVGVKSAARTGSADFTLNLPIVTPKPVEPPSVEPVTAKGSSNWLFFLLPLALILLIAIYAKRRFLTARPGPSNASLPPVFDSVRAAPAKPSSPKVSLAQLNLEDGTAFQLKDGLVTIGTAPDCSLRLPVSEAEFGQGSIRLWLTNGRFVLHDVSARPRVLVNGRPVNWSYLDNGDRLEIKGTRMQFERLDAPANV